MNPADDPAPSSVQRLFGGLFMAIGVLLIVTSGLCSLVYLASNLQGPTNEFSASGLHLIQLMAVWGGLPLLIGVGAFAIGRHLYRKK